MLLRRQRRNGMRGSERRYTLDDVTPRRHKEKEGTRGASERRAFVICARRCYARTACSRYGREVRVTAFASAWRANRAMQHSTRHARRVPVYTRALRVVTLFASRRVQRRATRYGNRRRGCSGESRRERRYREAPDAYGYANIVIMRRITICRVVCCVVARCRRFVAARRRQTATQSFGYGAVQLTKHNVVQRRVSIRARYAQYHVVMSCYGGENTCRC